MALNYFLLYAFTREELNMKIMTPRIDHMPQEDIHKLFNAIVDALFTIPMLHFLNGFINRYL
jgi:hypothetical protein